MLQSPRRTGLSGPTLVRLLARLQDADAPEAGQSLALQLSQWLDWTAAIALSSALKAQPAPAKSRAPAPESAEEQDCARVRAALAAAVADAATGGAPTRRRGSGRPVIPDPVEASAAFAPYRRRYATVQQTMESTIESLRGRLRATLAARGADRTKLAMVDAVMERVLGPREQSLLAAVPTLLEARFDHLRQSAETPPAEADAAAASTAPSAPGAWVGVFRNEMQSVLLAELDIRFQPVEGLLAALRGG
ncbi:DUF3348 domain-containing protein [Cupriavidus respiraculi]|uniref:DUF3348 domain-containing protein n=1 Tax=Cupriavidus respiraculi TaxID=195930 RepID=UPI001C96CE4D|nr:DUF3348 domain-containing protein [Cupriavidus respiraculi]MBY4948111.1 DUF3348 domain-containing protein [Cupriavidus respiraculi]